LVSVKTAAVRIAITIHNRDGQLVAYAGASLTDGTYKYPENFDRALELFNSYRAESAARKGAPLILVTDHFDVFRLYEAGYREVVALPTGVPSSRQLRTLFDLGGIGGLVTLLVSRNNEHGIEILSTLLPLVHVRLVRPDRPEKISELSVEAIQSLLRT
jgi:hypothetical protein